MKRFFLVLAVAALMATMLVVMAVPALAQPVVECEWDYFDEGWFAHYCWSPDFGWWIEDWWKAW